MAWYVVVFGPDGPSVGAIQRGDRIDEQGDGSLTIWLGDRVVFTAPGNSVARCEEFEHQRDADRRLKELREEALRFRASAAVHEESVVVVRHGGRRGGGFVEGSGVSVRLVDVSRPEPPEQH